MSKGESWHFCPSLSASGLRLCEGLSHAALPGSMVGISETSAVLFALVFDRDNGFD